MISFHGNIVKKSFKETIFSIPAKLRAKIATANLLLFYKYLIGELDRIQKRAMAISFLGIRISYNNAINVANIPRLEDHHKNKCTKLCSEINNNKGPCFTRVDAREASTILSANEKIPTISFTKDKNKEIEQLLYYQNV